MGHITLSVVTSVIIFLSYYLLVMGTGTGADEINQNQLNSLQQSQQEQHKQHPNRQTMQQRNYNRNHHLRGRSLPASPTQFGLGFNNGLNPPTRWVQVPRSSQLPIEIDFLTDDDDNLFVDKRFDDYGHMRFGKRTGGGEGDQFDDYGHMRFGRSSDIA